MCQGYMLLYRTGTGLYLPSVIHGLLHGTDSCSVYKKVVSKRTTTALSIPDLPPDKKSCHNSKLTFDRYTLLYKPSFKYMLNLMFHLILPWP